MKIIEDQLSAFIENSKPRHGVGATGLPCPGLNGYERQKDSRSEGDLGQIWVFPWEAVSRVPVPRELALSISHGQHRLGIITLPFQLSLSTHLIFLSWQKSAGEQNFSLQTTLYQSLSSMSSLVLMAAGTHWKVKALVLGADQEGRPGVGGGLPGVTTCLGSCG